MKKQMHGMLWMAVMLALGLTVACGGQTTIDAERAEEAEYEAPAEPVADARLDERTITASGCLMSSEAWTTPGSSQPADTMADFVLDVREDPSQPAPAAALEDHYRLRSTGDVSFSEHDGHTVRVTGTVSGEGSMSSREPTDDPNRQPTPSVGADEPSSDDAFPILMVTSIEHVAANCAAQPSNEQAPQ